jgi:hypothetical protein
MAMSDQEASQAYSELVDVMQGAGLEWVVHEVEEKRAVGRVRVEKLSREKLQVSKELWWDVAETSRERVRSGTAFVVAEEYSPQESLHLLIDALRIAVVGAHEAAMGAVNEMQEYGAKAIVFAPDSAVGQVRDLGLSELTRLEEVKKLDVVLSELQSEVGGVD